MEELLAQVSSASSQQKCKDMISQLSDATIHGLRAMI